MLRPALKILLLLTATFYIGCTSSQKTTAAQEPKPTVTMDAKAVQQTISTHHRYLKHCYGQLIAKPGKTDLNGKVVVQFKIGPDGKALEPKMVEELSTLKEMSLNQCLFEGLTTWDFPVHPEGEVVTINYPFAFQSRPPANMQQKLDRFEQIRKK